MGGWECAFARAMVSAPAENDADGPRPSRRATTAFIRYAEKRTPHDRIRHRGSLRPGTVTSIPKCHDRGYVPIHSTGAMCVGRTFSYRMVSVNADSRRIDGATYGYPTRR